MITPPCYPARPVNGGPLPKARPKHGVWRYEPKLNGWRAWVHTPTGQMFNRENQPLSITAEFRPVLDRIVARRAAGRCPDWLDVEALSRRVPVGKGSLILLDFWYDFAAGHTYDLRQQDIYGLFMAEDGAHAPICKMWAQEQMPPPENELLSFAYTYEDEAAQRERGATVIDPDLFPLAAWERLQQVNAALGCELFEGLVAKRADSIYPTQLRSSSQEFAYWMKHRWAF
jgi:hypothetical protein